MPTEAKRDKVAELTEAFSGSKGAIVSEYRGLTVSDLSKIRRDLRGVQLDLRKDIERLKTRLWFFDIALIPLLVAVLAIGLGIWRMRRRRSATVSANRAAAR